VAGPAEGAVAAAAAQQALKPAATS